MNDALDEGKRVLFEGAQGNMLDIDQGTYPFVTSSNPVAGGVTIGSGVGPAKINKVVGACKAYTSRVGDGPFPTELKNETGDFIREAGHEYGTVTKRPRRIGWFDSVVMRHSKRVSGLTNLCLNCVDVLTGLDEIKICTAYELNGEKIYHYPASLKECQDGRKISLSARLWKTFLKMHAIISIGSKILSASKFQRSQSDLTATRQTSWKTFGHKFSHGFFVTNLEA